MTINVIDVQPDDPLMGDAVLVYEQGEDLVSVYRQAPAGAVVLARLPEDISLGALQDILETHMPYVEEAAKQGGSLRWLVDMVPRWRDEGAAVYDAFYCRLRYMEALKERLSYDRRAVVRRLAEDLEEDACERHVWVADAQTYLYELGARMDLYEGLPARLPRGELREEDGRLVYILDGASMEAVTGPGAWDAPGVAEEDREVLARLVEF